MRTLSSRVGNSMLAFAVVALSACGGDSTSSGVTVPPVPVAPKISVLTLSSDSVVIDGSSTPFTATIDNVAPDIQGVMIQGHITQGTTRRATGSMQINCSGAAAQPKGPCVVSYAIEASNSGDGTGTLVEGAATFELQLTQNGAALDTKTAAVKLASKPPVISIVSLSSDMATIDGAAVTLSAKIENVGASLSGVAIQGYATQGTARRAAGSMQIDCGSGVNVLPTGTCAVSVVLDASNDSAGTGLLVQGAAKFELQLTRNGTALDTAAIAATLVSNKPPRIRALTLSSDTATIEGTATPYTVTIENTGPSLSGVFIQGVVVQGTVEQPAGGTVVICGSGNGVLPTAFPSGVCTAGSDWGVSNRFSGAVVPGPATFELDLYVNNNGVNMLVDKKTIQVTLKNP